MFFGPAPTCISEFAECERSALRQRQTEQHLGWAKANRNHWNSQEDWRSPHSTIENWQSTDGRTWQKDTKSRLKHGWASQSSRHHAKDSIAWTISEQFKTWTCLNKECIALGHPSTPRTPSTHIHHWNHANALKSSQFAQIIPCLDVKLHFQHFNYLWLI